MYHSLYHDGTLTQVGATSIRSFTAGLHISINFPDAIFKILHFHNRYCIISKKTWPKFTCQQAILIAPCCWAMGHIEPCVVQKPHPDLPMAHEI